MPQKVMTKYKIGVIEYDPTGYYYPRYQSSQVVIAETKEEAIKKAIDRSPWQHSMGYSWEKRAEVIYSEDILVEEGVKQ